MAHGALMTAHVVVNGVVGKEPSRSIVEVLLISSRSPPTDIEESYNAHASPKGPLGVSGEASRSHLGIVAMATVLSLVMARRLEAES